MEDISKKYKRYLKHSHILNNEIFNNKKYFRMMIDKNKHFINTYIKTIGIYDKLIKKCIINATINCNICEDFTDSFDNMIRLFKDFEMLFFKQLYNPYYEKFINKENIDISCNNLFGDNIINNCNYIALYQLYQLYNRTICSEYRENGEYRENDENGENSVNSENSENSEYCVNSEKSNNTTDIEIIEDIEEHIISKYLPDNKSNNYLIFSIVGFIVLFIVLLIVLIILAVKYHRSKKII